MNAASSWLDSVAARERWHAVLKARGPRVAVWVLAIALGAEAASIVTRLAGTGSTPAPAPLTAAAPEAARIDVAEIAAGHLFGAAPVAAPSGPTNAPQTTMALVLTGTIAANHPKDGMAILGPSATQARVYAVGDSVPGGARLYAVYDDHVLLDRAGRLETLALPHKLSGTTAAAPLLSNAPQNSFERIRRVVTQDPGIVADVMRPQPVFADGKQRGYRVYPGRNSQAFMSLGLRPGDLVISINNTPLDDPTRGDEIFRTLGSSSEARVTVMRNGRQQDLTLNMSAIASEADQLSEEQQSGAGAGGAVPPATPAGTGPQGPD